MSTHPFPGCRPVADAISCPFGEKGIHWKRGWHGGVDFKCVLKTPGRAYHDGEVAIAGYYDDGFGKRVVLAHFDGWTSLYCHLDDYFVGVGDKVKKGAFFYSTGNSGVITDHLTGLTRPVPPHLHFELRKDNFPQEPEFEESLQCKVCKDCKETEDLYGKTA